MTDDNIIRLATVQDAGELPASSEDALALAYAERHANDTRHVAAWSRWMLYDGARWNTDATLHVFNRARVICPEVALECARPAAVVAAKTVAAVVQLARADRRLAATAEQWDANHMQLVTAGDDDIPAAAYDLATGIAGAPDPFAYMTKATACGAAPVGTACPQWSAFLDRITAGNAELQDFLQRYIGYCCAGLTIEHAFVFAYGTGANSRAHSSTPLFASRRLRRHCRHGHVHREQRRASPGRSGQAARRPPGGCPGNPKRTSLGRSPRSRH